MTNRFVETILLHIEKKGRGGKIVTILEGFTRDQFYLKGLARNFKKSFGTGGTLNDQRIEIQGDFRPQLRRTLLKEGFRVKG